jgi:hypothetical protein
LEPRAGLSLLLGYSEETFGYKFVDIKTAQVVTAQRGNVTFHEEYTTDSTYVQHLMDNSFQYGDHELPETVPVARIKTSMDTYLSDQTAASATAARQLEIVPPVDELPEPLQRSASRQQDADSPVCDDSAESQPDAATSADLQIPAQAPQ